MYDVKSAKVTGETVELLVINDKKEKALLKDIKDFLNKSSQEKKELPDQLQKFLSLNYLSAEKESILYLPCILPSIYHYRGHNTLSVGPDIPSPPPKILG
jgi:hypothetical protein